MRSQNRSVRAATIAAVAAVTFGAISAATANTPFSLTVIHSNDMESALLPNAANRFTSGGVQYDIGGAAAFVSVAKRLQSNATTDGVVTLSAGDAWLPGLALDASRTRPSPLPWYDALAQRRVGYQAMTLGNHEFDLGPQGTKDFINSYNATTNLPSGATLADFPVNNAPFLTNVDLSTEPGYGGTDSILNRIAKSTVITTGGQQVGVVGLTTPLLSQISSPGNVTFPGGLTLADAAAAANAEALALRNQGVTKIVLSAHLQNIRNDLSIIPLLQNFDVVISAGGHELMTQPAGSPFALIPGDAPNATRVTGPNTTAPLTYGQVFTGGDGKNVALVTANALYRYVGNLVVNFDANGDVVGVDNSKSGQARVLRQVGGAGTPLPDVVVADAPTAQFVEAPVKSYVDVQNAIVLGTSEVALNGNRNPGLRTRETNLGNFAADALVWQVEQLVPTRTGPIVGLQNGGGLRFEGTIPAGNITRGDLARTAPFFNLVSLIPDLSPSALKAVLERGVSGLPAADGRYGQFSGVRFLFDPARPAGDRIYQIFLDTDDNGTQELFFDFGTYLFPTLTVDLATIDFLARGGDGYPLATFDFQNLGTTYQQAFENYLTGSTSVGGLGGVISAAQYAPGLPPSRSVAVPEPTSLAGVAVAAGALISRRRRTA